MARLKLSLACWDYDRTRALADGSVRAQGIDLVYLTLPPEETFLRMLKKREFDCAEMSLSTYAMTLTRKDPPFVAIPVFPSRFFRHSCVFVSSKSGIRRPAQLAGRTVGIPEYQMTAAVWIRGMLEDEYGVKCAGMSYRTGGLEEPGRREKLALDLPAKFRVTPIGPQQTLSRMLADGEIDALYSARTPATLSSEPRAVKRLFPDYGKAERAYFRRTRIFPIMHTLVIRRDLYEKHRWIAASLYQAFAAAQQKTYEDFAQTSAMKTMLPWLVEHVEEARRAMGAHWWSYGLEPNRHVLDTFLRYHREQGLSRRRLAPEALFAPETLESFRI
jgi:4,5-dihydroxyphthalate decarboxylase